MVHRSNVSTETPKAPPSLKKSISSSKNQTSIAGFFQKKGLDTSTIPTPTLNRSKLPLRQSPRKKSTKSYSSTSISSLTPAPSSDAAEDVEPETETPPIASDTNGAVNGLPSPATPASIIASGDGAADDKPPKGFYSPSRKVHMLPFKAQWPMLTFA